MLSFREFHIRRKKEEGRRKKEEGRRKREEGRRKKEEGRGKKEEGRRKRGGASHICKNTSSGSFFLPLSSCILPPVSNF
ncbi:hypothetical protein [Microcoleus sp. S13_B4]|uniref:hypothetical protein n=1 Tax=Microcoleus sp. S13_B4 TaxID=3055408 RepID=UPI002FD0A8BA